MAKSNSRVQGGACAICKWVPGIGDRDLDLDHEHDGAPRGFLHGNCNRGLGHFKDDVKIIRKAIEYLSGPTLGIVYKKSWRKRGVPAAIREQILTSQNGLCKICSTDLTNKKTCVDHDHLTNLIRGILCDGCNCGLGHFDDSVKLLTNAIGYLLNYEESKVTDAYVAVRDATSTKQLLPTGGFTQARRQPPPKQQPPSIPIVLLIISGE